jgi:DNA polymerase-4
MKTILLIDMDSFFASVEQQTNPLLRGKPIAVIGSAKRTVVTTASYEARAFGVKTGMNMWEAKKLCRHLIFVVGNNEKYAHTCEKLAKIYSKYTPKVEIYSIDEAFLDITSSCKLIGSPLEIGGNIKDKIKQQFGLNASVGIGPNKLIAKLASDLSKPDGLLWIRTEDIPGTLENLPVDELWGIGKKLSEKLNSLGIYTCGELGRTCASFLRSRFGIIGERLKLMGMGIDHSPVVCTQHEVKSIGHSMTLPRDIWQRRDIDAYMLKLSEMVGRRARKHKLMGNAVSVIIRYRSFETFSRQSKTGMHTNDTHNIYNNAMRIIKGLKLKDSIRLLGVSLFGLTESEKPAQLPLLREYARRQDLLQAMDRINDRYGDLTVSWAGYMLYSSQTPVISPAWRPKGIHRTRV